MPLYDYKCEAGHRYEKRESFGSPAEQPCQRCGKPARRLLNAPPLIFKGGGFYKTESRGKEPMERRSSSSDEKSDEKSSVKRPAKASKDSGSSKNGSSSSKNGSSGSSSSGSSSSSKAKSSSD